MLQIISGKFFTGLDTHCHEGKGILYSNCKWYAPIKTAIGVLEPVDDSGDITGFVFNYKNQIEQDGLLVRCGDDEILEQFKLLCSFGLEAYFSEYREQVIRICSPIKNKNIKRNNATQFLEEKVKFNTVLTNTKIENFIKITNKVISLERQSYKKIIIALRSISDSIETLSYNIDQAYSMLVYCIESLSQTSNDAQSTWEDWDQDNKRKLESVLEQIPDEKSLEIKNILLQDKNFKLQRRFISFVEENIADSFFINEADGVQIPLRKSQLVQSLRNTYKMRSKFVHSLQTIQDQIRHPEFGKNDVFTFSENPYLTYRGLFRLTTHILTNYIYSLPSIDQEKFDYREDLPCIMKVEMAPQYWIWQSESFNAKTVNRRLGAFLGQLEQNQVTELTQIMEKIKEIFLQTPDSQRAPMLYLFWIYNNVIAENLRIDEWKNFVEKHISYFSKLRIENIAVRVVARQDIPWNFHLCITEYKNYVRLKSKEGHLSLTPVTEAAILCKIANKAWEFGAGSEYNWLLNSAIFELAGRKEIQVFLYQSMISFEKIDVNKLLDWYKNN